MKNFRIQLVWLILVFMSPLANASTQDAPNADGQSTPVAVTPEVNFQFKDIVEGQPITHDFPVFNKGKAELLIQNVKAG